jgi:hypothetical protein
MADTVLLEHIVRRHDKMTRTRKNEVERTFPTSEMGLPLRSFPKHAPAQQQQQR